MNGKLNIKVSGGTFSVGQLVQGENVTMIGGAQVQTPPEALAAFHMDLRQQIANHSLSTDERAMLEERVAALEAALLVASQNRNEWTLQRVRQTVEDLTGIFGWTVPILKKLLAICAPSLALLP